MTSPSSPFRLLQGFSRSTRVGGLMRGSIVGATAEDEPLVRIDDEPDREPRVAETLVELTRQHVGRQVLIAFIEGEPEQPVICGLLSRKLAPARPRRAEFCAEELFLQGQRTLTLVCGQARIQLTRDGRIEIRGVDLLSRTSGSHRIRAGRIQLN